MSSAPRSAGISIGSSFQRCFITCHGRQPLRQILKKKRFPVIEEAKDQDQDKKIISKGANLKGRDLRYCRAKSALMAKADLRSANLEGAYCRGSETCRKARLGEVGYPEEQAARLPESCESFQGRPHRRLLIQSRPLQGFAGRSNADRGQPGGGCLGRSQSQLYSPEKCQTWRCHTACGQSPGGPT